MTIVHFIGIYYFIGTEYKVSKLVIWFLELFLQNKIMVWINILSFYQFLSVTLILA